MNITSQQFKQYLNVNRKKTKYSIGVDNYFTFELHPRNKGISCFPFTIRFSSPKWSKKNVSSIGPENIKRYLKIFNDDKDTSASEYKNLGEKESISKNARYLVILLNELVKQNS